MAHGLDGVTDIMVITDLVMRGGTLRERLMPLFLSGLGIPSPWAVRAAARGVKIASFYQWGVSVGVIPVGDSRWLGWSGAMPGSRALGLLLESDVEKPSCLV